MLEEFTLSEAEGLRTPFLQRKMKLEINMNENIFRILATIIFLAGISISIYFRRKADKDTGEKVSYEDEGRAMFLILRIGGLVLWLSMLGYLIYPPLLA